LIEEQEKLYLRSNLNLVGGDGGRPFDLVVSRGLCQYMVSDLSAVRREDRDSALRLQMTRSSPFREFDCFIRWQGDTAETWFWDTARMASILDESSFRILDSYPAPVFVPQEAPRELVRYEDGYEARVWKDGYISASRWYPEQPGADDLAIFLRSEAGVADTDSDFREVDGTDGYRNMSAQPGGGNERLVRDATLAIGVAVVILTFIVFSWEVIAVGKAWWTGNRLVSELAQLEEKSEPQFRFREAAFRAQDFVKYMRDQGPYPTQLELKAQVNRLLLDEDVQLRYWKFSDSRLSIILSGAEFDLVAYTRAFDNSSAFAAADVRRGRTPDELVVELEVLRAVD